MEGAHKKRHNNFFKNILLFRQLLTDVSRLLNRVIGEFFPKKLIAGVQNLKENVNALINIGLRIRSNNTKYM